jgi:hypothetical protein
VALLLIGAFATPIGARVTDRLFPERGRLEVVENASTMLDVTPAVIDVRVQNTGSRRVVAKRVTLVIKEVVTVDVCATEGEIPITGTYDVAVPVEPSPGEVLEHALDQQIAADVVVSLPVLPDNQLAAWYWGSRWVAEPLDWLGSRQASTEECLHTNLR